MSTAIETPYTLLIIAAAPESSGQILEKIQESFSFIPNLMAIFGNNPTVLEGYSALHAIYNEGFAPESERVGAGDREAELSLDKPVLRGITSGNV